MAISKHPWRCSHSHSSEPSFSFLGLDWEVDMVEPISTMSLRTTFSNSPHVSRPWGWSLQSQENVTTAPINEFPMHQITKEWLVELGGISGTAAYGGQYWDFPIVTKQCPQGETYLRVHEPDGDVEWATDLFDRNGQAVGIVNWPTSRQHMLAMLDVLGCVRNRLSSEDGKVCASCARALNSQQNSE